VARLEFSRSATRALEDVFSYTYERWGHDQAQNYLDQLERSCMTLAENPGLGVSSPMAGEGYRRYFAGSHWLYYKQIPGGVRVMAVMHARRQPPP